MPGIAQYLLKAQTNVGAVGTTPIAFRTLGHRQTVHDIHWDAGVSVGEVTVEAAHRETDTEWTPIQVVAFSGTAPKREPSVVVSGAYGAFRHRISGPINDGGTVTTYIRGELMEA